MDPSTTLRRAWLLVFSIVLVASTQAAAQAGQLDPTFGTGGIVTTDFGNQINSDVATANAVTIQPDGKIVVCGGAPGSNGFPNAAVVRYNPTAARTRGLETPASTSFWGSSRSSPQSHFKPTARL